MSMPALHTLSLSPARHLLACQQVADRSLWPADPSLGWLQRCQLTSRWLLARYALLSPSVISSAGETREGIARRLCAEVCAEVEAEESVLDPRLQRATRARVRAAGSALRARRSVLRRMVERVMDGTPDARLADARVLALGKVYERHVRQTMQSIGPLLCQPTGADLSRSMQARHDVLLRRLRALH